MSARGARVKMLVNEQRIIMIGVNTTRAQDYDALLRDDRTHHPTPRGAQCAPPFYGGERRVRAFVYAVHIRARSRASRDARVVASRLQSLMPAYAAATPPADAATRHARR